MSVKSVVKAHFIHGPISEHIKKHRTFFSENRLDPILSQDETFKMRRFTIEDMDGCVELYKDVFSADPWKDGWESVDQVRYYLMELIENPVFEGFVAYEDSKMVAVCFGHKRSWWTGKEFFIDELFVGKEMQGNGIGTKLLGYVECNPVTRDCMRLILLTNRGVPAEEFYIKRGFKMVQNRIIMAKNI